jgi:FkbM family methyltransferase
MEVAVREIKKIISRAIRRLGYEVIPLWQVQTYQNASYLRRLFEYLSIDCVIDVGANEGQYVDFLRAEVGYEGLICSFEPIPSLSSALRSRARNCDLWEIYPFALGAERGKQIFNVTSETALSSFLRADGQQIDMGKLTAIEKEIEVEVETLDSILPSIIKNKNVNNIHLKLDTQGYDLHVLRGGDGVLSSLSSLQTEMSVRKIYRGMPNFRESIAYIEERGFLLSEVFSVNSGCFPILVEFDCYAIRNDRIGGKLGWDPVCAKISLNQRDV